MKHMGHQLPAHQRLIAGVSTARTVAAMTTTPDAKGQPLLSEVAARIETDTDPLSRLEGIRILRERLATAEADAVRDARRGNVSWRAIGERLGVSKQGAQARHERREPGQQVVADAEKPRHQRTATKPRKALGSWELTTPRGRTLLRLRPVRTPPLAEQTPAGKRPPASGHEIGIRASSGCGEDGVHDFPEPLGGVWPSRGS